MTETASSRALRLLGTFLVTATGALFVPLLAFAHVKWFARFSLSDQPATLAEILTPVFFGLAALSVVVIGLLVVVDRRMEDTEWYERLDQWLASRAPQSLLILRIAAGATLLLSWQANSMLAPELTDGAWAGWYQFLLALLLLFPRTVPLAGAGLLLLYLFGVVRFGAFHMLDYVHYVGVSWFLIVGQARNVRLRETRIPALYLAVGFSLCWLALEKIVYPQWTLYILAQNPHLALGLDPDFFRVGAAFVEFALGYLLIICLFERPLAVVVTLVFFSTTLVFGKLEVIGHTLIHGALIVFLFEGPGRFYRPPIAFHERMPLRAAFASVNYVILLAIILFAYYYSAWHVSGAHAAAHL